MKKYRVNIYINKKVKSFELGDATIDLPKPEEGYTRYIKFEVPSDYEVGIRNWENDMINGVLGNFKGVNWNNVITIDY